MVRGGEWKEAEAVLTEVLGLSPEDEAARRLYEQVRAGQQAEEKERKEQAGRLMEEAQRAAERGDLARLEWLMEEAARARHPEVVEEAERLLWKAREEHLPPDELLALALERMPHDRGRAERLLRSVLCRRPDHPEAAFYLELLLAEDDRAGWP